MFKLAIFDMDGTIFESYLDWTKIKLELGIESNILKELNKPCQILLVMQLSIPPPTKK